ncbi:hypothetical protein K438DRAFT_1933559 [Mycena galopus ATCC 62051]|nr:hypothetical protein K438DRAFT_1933559 [Mycena galopus ATCC 62051]
MGWVLSGLDEYQARLTESRLFDLYDHKMRRLGFMLLSMVVFALAQFNYPPCVEDCFEAATLISSCGQDDTRCQCTDVTIQADTASCVVGECSPADYANGTAYIASLCEDVLVPFTTWTTTASPAFLPSNPAADINGTPVPGDTYTSPKQSHTGAIVGGVIGGVALITCVGAALLLLTRHTSKARAPDRIPKPSEGTRPPAPTGPPTWLGAPLASGSRNVGANAYTPPPGSAVPPNWHGGPVVNAYTPPQPTAQAWRGPVNAQTYTTTPMEPEQAHHPGRERNAGVGAEANAINAQTTTPTESEQGQQLERDQNAGMGAEAPEADPEADPDATGGESCAAAFLSRINGGPRAVGPRFLVEIVKYIGVLRRLPARQWCTTSAASLMQYTLVKEATIERQGQRSFEELKAASEKAFMVKDGSISPVAPARGFETRRDHNVSDITYTKVVSIASSNGEGTGTPRNVITAIEDDPHPVNVSRVVGARGAGGDSNVVFR